MLSSAFKLPENSKIEFQRFEKWHNVSYRYVSYVKSEASDTVKSRIKTHPDIGSPEYRPTLVLMQNLSCF